MRFLSAFFNDVRYQLKYGLYLIYAFISAIYIGILFLCPLEHKKIIASIIILTDPATLGVFFIGGIWLLEKNEGLHKFIAISPMRPIEYILSKAVSLACISTLSTLIIVSIGLIKNIDYPLFIVSIFLGSMLFTVIGLIIASYCNSVNHYLIIMTSPAVVLILPTVLVVLGLYNPILDIFPGTALWRIISCSMGLANIETIWLFICLFLWLGLAFYIANIRIPNAMQMERSGKL